MSCNPFNYFFFRNLEPLSLPKNYKKNDISKRQQ
nr:MAG TPA: hypothetical protein [Caudoviricetes sp.]